MHHAFKSGNWTELTSCLYQYEFPKANAFLKELEAEAELANQPGAQKKRKIDDVEPEEETKENKVEAETKPSTESSKPEIDADLPDVDMNVEPKVGPIDEERPYKKASCIGYRWNTCELTNTFMQLIDFRNKTYLAPLTTVCGIALWWYFFWITNHDDEW